MYNKLVSGTIPVQFAYAVKKVSIHIEESTVSATVTL